MNSLAAIDIGSTKAVTLIADTDGAGPPRIVAVGVAPCQGVKRGTVADIEETAAAVVASVRKSEQMANRKIGHVIVSVTGEHINGMSSQGIVPIVPPARTITREDVHRVINHSKQIALEPERELILAVPKAFKVDGQDGVSRPFGMSGERLEVNTLLVTGLVTHLQNLERCVNRAQIEVDHIVPQPLASSLATLSPGEMQAGALMIDIGGGTTDIAVYNCGSISFMAMLPVGAQHITADIAKLLKTTPEEAERLKQQEGTCLPDEVEEKEPVQITQIGQTEARPYRKKVLAQIIEARAKEILTLVKQAIVHGGYYDGLDSVVLTGGGAKTRCLKELAETVFDGRAVRIGTPSQLAGLSDMVAGPEHATAVGLIKYGLRIREEETVAAEEGDWKKIIRGIGSIFAPRPREDAK